MGHKVKFTVKLAPEKPSQSFTIAVQEDWAPLGASRFMDLVMDSNFDEGRFYRVVPNFMAQFGIAADPAKYSKWGSSLIKDDPVKESNTRGRISFAMRGPDTRSCQVFINFGDNSNLDSEGFAPFGEVIEGMDVVDGIFSGYGDEPYRQPIKEQGNACLDRYPQLSFIEKVEKL